MLLQFKDKKLNLDSPRIMGILNVTLDSFSDGGLYLNTDNALRQAQLMIEQGADIIDIGAESTRAGSDGVSDEIQLERLSHLTRAISSNFDTIISIDTSSPFVMTECVRDGAHMWNDIRALQEDGAVETCAKLGIPVCLMHMQGTPRTMQINPTYDDVVKEVSDFLVQRADVCINHGIKKENIIIDPGFGYGKNATHNYRLLSNLDKLCSLGFVLLSALSRKSMLGYATGIDKPADRITASVSGAVISVLKGASIVRVHDVKETKEALDVAAQVLLNP